MVIVPGLVPADAVHVDQDAHQLGDGDRRMGIVELDRGLVGEVLERRRCWRMCRRTRSCSEAEAKKYSCRSRSSCPAGVASLGIEHLGDRLSAARASASAPTWSPWLKASSRSGSAARADHSRSVLTWRAAPADDRRVEGDGVDRLRPASRRGAPCRRRRRWPRPCRRSRCRRRLRGRSNSQGLPKESQSSGIFLLPAVLDDLAEQAVVVADAVAIGGDREGRHAFHEAGREAAEAAIAQRGVGLDLAQLLEIDVEAVQRRADGLGQPEIASGRRASSRPIRNSSER